MASVRGSLKIVESNRQVRELISKAMQNELNLALLKASQLANDEIRQVLYVALINQPEVASLDSGRLMMEFGLVDGLSRIKEAISMWVNQVYIRRERVRLTSMGFTGSFTLQYVQRDFEDVLGEDFAVFTTEKGTDLEWLRWLLLMGDNMAIVKGWNVSKKNLPEYSRTGTVIMIKKKGDRWSVPREFAGNIKSNMVTRAINSPDVSNKIIKILENALRDA